MWLDGSAVYNLFAVLVHRGPSASSGHYIAVIKDPVSGVTYKFNDTEVEKEKRFNLANEEDDGSDSVLLILTTVCLSNVVLAAPDEIESETEVLV